MSIGRRRNVLMGLCLVAPIFAGLPAASGQTEQRDILVNGTVSKHQVDWKRAESEHVVVLSKGSPAELTRITKNLERLYQLMSRLYRHGDQADDTVKLQVTLVDSAADLRAMELTSPRSVEGPYLSAFSNLTYYDPREDGEVIAIARGDRIVDLNTNRAYNLDCDDAMAQGAQQCMGNVPYHPPAVRTWEESLYAAFARRFVQTYNPAAYPRWYLDGVGALFSTVSVRGNGAIDYARPPLSYKLVFRAYGDLNVRDILEGRYLGDMKMPGWSPYHAWLLAHFFLFSNLKPERARQFRAYMTAIYQGKPMTEAAKTFGDMKALQRDLTSYVDADKSFARTAAPQAPIEEPLVTALSPGSAALVEARLELGARLAIGSDAVAPDTAPATTTADPTEMSRRDSWVAQMRDIVARLPYDADALLFAAETECRAGHDAECRADAERILATSPDNVRALAWKGVALTGQAIAGPAAERPAALTVARATIERAIELDRQAPLPLIAYFQSYTKAGERVPDQAMLGMATVVRDVPAAPAPRLYLAQELMRQGKPDLARNLVHILLYGPYDAQQRIAAEALFPRGDPLSGGR